MDCTAPGAYSSGFRPEAGRPTGQARPRFYPHQGILDFAGDLYITELDAIGADSLYPLFPGCNDAVYFIDGPYAGMTNGSPFTSVSTYLDYPGGATAGGT